MEVIIRSANSLSEVPKQLLLLADPSEEMIEKYLKDGECYIAETNDEIIGVMVIISRNSESIEVINLAVREDWQGNGVGKKLLSKANEVGRMRNVKRIEIGTGNSSVQQLGIYQRCGYRIFEIWEDYFVNHYEEEIYENGIQCRDMIRLKIDL